MAAFTDQVVEACAPWLEKDNTGTLQPFLEAYSGMFDQVADIVSDQGFAQDPLLLGWVPTSDYTVGQLVEATDGNLYTCVVNNINKDPLTSPTYWSLVHTGTAGTYSPGWSILLDPARCPDRFLTYCGQFIGVQVPPGTDPVIARSQIIAECGFFRGTRGSIEWAVKQNLTGAKSCTVLERMAANGSADAYHFIVIVRPEEIVNVDLLIAMVNDRKPAGLQWTLVAVDGFTWNQAIHTWNAETMTWVGTLTSQP